MEILLIILIYILHLSFKLILFVIYLLTYLVTHSMALVRKRTIPTDRPPLVGEVSANFCG
jgi:hypothetical protein